MRAYEEGRTFGFRGSFARLVHVEALLAVGERDQARAKLAAARDRLLKTAALIPDPALRESFFRRVPEHARTLELAEALGDTRIGSEND